MATVPELRAASQARRGAATASLRDRLRFPLVAYVLSRVVYLVIALVDTLIRHWPLGPELRNWDGKWYLLTAQHWYPSTIPHHYSTLGFEPLYPMLMWVGNQVLPRGYEISGLIVSLVLGAVATVEMSFLAERWFGAAAARRATIFLCVFPGTIVYSMVYSEGLGLALVAGSLLALANCRWVLAGALAGLATAVAPVLLAIIPALALFSLRELYRRGWRDRQALASLAAPLLAPAGAVAFAVYLWFHDGTPMASYKAQRYAWGESSSPIAVYDQAKRFVDRGLTHWHGLSALDMNLVAGVVGAVFLLWGIWQMWRSHRVPLEAWIWTLGVSVLTLTSQNTPPNPRMLLCNFPVLLTVGARFSGRSQKILLGITALITVVMSIATFVGTGLRP